MGNRDSKGPTLSDSIDVSCPEQAEMGSRFPVARGWGMTVHSVELHGEGGTSISKSPRVPTHKQGWQPLCWTFQGC